MVPAAFRETDLVGPAVPGSDMMTMEVRRPEPTAAAPECRQPQRPNEVHIIRTYISSSLVDLGLASALFFVCCAALAQQPYPA